jgi:hypothetical protein
MAVGSPWLAVYNITIVDPEALPMCIHFFSCFVWVAIGVWM